MALLPDALFFIRAVSVTPGATPADARTQIELALEGISPFPLAQLYYGWFWTPGAESAFVFAAYRRRFTSEQTAAWEGAELVLPAFATVFGAPVEAATTILLTSPEGLTAVHWEKAGVPAQVLFRPIEAESTDEQRSAVREELLRQLGGSRKVIELDSPLQVDPAQSDREVIFRAGDLVSRVPASLASALDVRDKGELASLRQARSRDLLLWRVMLGCAAALLIMALGELALVGGRMWQDVRLGKIRGQKSTVDKIEAASRLTNRIEELATKRMLPFEMIEVLKAEGKKPDEILFTRVVTNPQAGIYTLIIDAKATNTAQVSAYVSTLRNLPMVARVEDRDLRSRGDSATFTLVVTFRPEALKPADSISQ